MVKAQQTMAYIIPLTCVTNKLMLYVNVTVLSFETYSMLFTLLH